MAYPGRGVIRDILIPWFATDLQGRLRTFSAGGVTNLEPTITEFQRLITFVHLEPVYRDRMWIRVDGDEPGQKMIEKVVTMFPYLAPPRSGTFSKPQFEMYYPARFTDEVQAALNISDKLQRRTAKAKMLLKVVEWSFQNESEARSAWASSAAEQIELLRQVGKTLTTR